MKHGRVVFMFALTLASCVESAPTRGCDVESEYVDLLQSTCDAFADDLWLGVTIESAAWFEAVRIEHYPALRELREVMLLDRAPYYHVAINVEHVDSASCLLLHAIRHARLHQETGDSDGDHELPGWGAECSCGRE